MNHALKFAHAVDRLNNGFGWIAVWAAFLSCMLSAANAILRYSASLSSNAWLEIQWYLFGACVMFGAGVVLRVNEHVRVDVLYSRYAPRTKAWVDLLGILFFLMMAGLAVYAVLFAGWSSNNKYSLLGAMRASAQTLSYEVFLGLSLMGVVAQAGSFNMTDIVNNQAHLWNVIPQFFGFVTFAIAGVAVCHRHPFDQPEAEQELADGYHIEYSGMKFGLFFVGEYIGIVTVSALIVTLFFGGWNGPWLPPFIWFALKTAFFMMMFILIRASLPRPRYDQVMSFGWKVCLPLTLINLLVTAAVILWQAQ